MYNVSFMSNDIPETLFDKLTGYRVPQAAAELIRSTDIVFLVGVAGAGKDTIINELLKSGDYHYIVSHTTRAPRHNHGVLERDGFEYHFIDRAEAERMLDAEEFIEAKLVHGNIYGTSVAEIQTAKDKSEIAISEIEVQGIAEYRSVSDTVLPIFLLPPSYDIWQQRLTKRYGDAIDTDDLRKRLLTAQDELQEALSKDYYEFVVNDDLNIAISIVDQIAHGNLSPEKNEQAKAIAKQLLSDLSQNLA
jgi:guanylate kinase